MRKKEIKLLGLIVIIEILLIILLGVLNQQVDEEEITSIIQPLTNYTEVAPSVEHIEMPLDDAEVLPVVKAWDDIPLDYDLQVALYDKCEELNISFWFMLSLLESESSYRANAKGDGGNSIGYMQINKVNWERMKTQYGLDVHQPLDNLYCGCYMVAELFEKYDTEEKVIMGYKCGESRMKKLIKEGRTISGVKKVLNRKEELEQAHEN